MIQERGRGFGGEAYIESAGEHAALQLVVRPCCFGSACAPPSTGGIAVGHMCARAHTTGRVGPAAWRGCPLDASPIGKPIREAAHLHVIRVDGNYFIHSRRKAQVHQCHPEHRLRKASAHIHEVRTYHVTWEKLRQRDIGCRAQVEDDARRSSKPDVSERAAQLESPRRQT
eukprot:scaffold98767_cov32-Tisochrysis_lutea.AAC.1